MLQGTVRIAGFLQQVGGTSLKREMPSAPEATTPPISDAVSLASPNRYLQGSDGSQVALPESGRFQLGRHADCQVQLDGDLVSRKHCEGEFRNGQLWLRDRSSNGTFVNGEALPHGEWVEVAKDSQVGFGQSVHTMQLGSRSESEPVQGPQGQTFDWPAGQSLVRVGNADGSHLKPGDEGVSDNHALLRKVDGKVMVMDTQSSQGTYVAGERLQPMVWTEVPQGTGLAFGNPESNWLL